MFSQEHPRVNVVTRLRNQTAPTQEPGREQRSDSSHGEEIGHDNPAIREQVIIEQTEEESEKHSLDHPILPVPTTNPHIRDGVAPFPEQLQPIPLVRKSSIKRQGSNANFDLWGMLKKCEVSLDLTTLADISPLCQKELY